MNQTFDLSIIERSITTMAAQTQALGASLQQQQQQHAQEMQRQYQWMQQQHQQNITQQQANTDALAALKRTTEATATARELNKMFDTIRIFDGTDKEYFLDWVHNLESLCYETRGNIREWAIRKSSGNVRSTLLTLPNTLTWSMIKKELMRNYSDMPSMSHAAQKLYNIQQTRDEDTLNYNIRYARLHTLVIGKDLGVQTDQDRIIHYLCSLRNQGIAGKIGRLAPYKYPKTLREAFKLACEYEATLQREEGIHRIRLNRNPQINEIEVNNVDSYQCWYCGQVGHMQPDCPDKLAGKPRRYVRMPKIQGQGRIVGEIQYNVTGKSPLTEESLALLVKDSLLRSVASTAVKKAGPRKSMANVITATMGSTIPSTTTEAAISLDLARTAVVNTTKAAAIEGRDIRQTRSRTRKAQAAMAVNAIEDPYLEAAHNLIEKWKGEAMVEVIEEIGLAAIPEESGDLIDLNDGNPPESQSPTM